ncbi:unnamed protein product [Angiostrongylus costaricensis]|uniref:Sulfatase domain-containing protein n=1 Tax=Angiostrongylus costaricensis TaxID=334426 RepID=A0A158PHN0_ANGCS|nr:unnamed protein product [Angiostrongylus costaricensis]
MAGLWVLYSFIVIGLLYYVCYNVFIDNANTKPYSNSVEVIGMNEAANNTVEDSKLSDVFDTCPFELPDPWDSTILKYVDVKYGFLKDCAPNITLQPITELKNATVIIKEHEGFSCEARCINYVDDSNYEATGWKSIEKNEFKCDFVETSCKSNSTTNRFIHTQISEQTALPRTVNFLLHGMEAIEFRKFNKVGSNSRPNAFVTLLGKTTEAVVRTQMKLQTIEADLTYKQLCKQYLDDYPYIPLEYMKAGYKTFGGEDYVASVLNYPDCYGMKQKQFHHIYRPFYLRLSKDDELKSIHEKSVCRESRNNVIDYLSKFLGSYKVKFKPVVWLSTTLAVCYGCLSKFSLSWLVDLAHDNTHDLYRADYDLYEFFVNNRDALNNSFIFFFGDHGPRFGSEAYTDFGKQEGNNPFLYVIIPKNLRHTTMHNQLRRNSEELVTHHDLHSTFKDILYYQPVSSFSNVTFMKFDSNPRGSSLLRRFEDGIRRTCKTLPISFNYCICQYRAEIVSGSNRTEELGQFAAKRLSSVLESHRVSTMCEKISLEKVIKVEKYVLSNENTTFSATVNDYNLVFEVAPPARGQFQIPIRTERGKMKIGEERFIRLDKYGNNGDCMANDILRPLCTCKNNSS